LEGSFCFAYYFTLLNGTGCTAPPPKRIAGRKKPVIGVKALRSYAVFHISRKVNIEIKGCQNPASNRSLYAHHVIRLEDIKAAAG